MTYSDYLKSKNEQKFSQAPIISAEIKEEKRQEVETEKFEYVMAHPDRTGGLLSNNGKYILDDIELQMESGILTVTETQKKKLVSQGFIFLYRKEKEVE